MAKTETETDEQTDKEREKRERGFRKKELPEKVENMGEGGGALQLVGRPSRVRCCRVVVSVVWSLGVPSV